MLRSSFALAIVAVGLIALPASDALAHERGVWHQGWHGGHGWWGPVIRVAPVPYYAPPVAYAPPVYYAPPPRWTWYRRHPGMVTYRR